MKQTNFSAPSHNSFHAEGVVEYALFSLLRIREMLCTGHQPLSVPVQLEQALTND